MILTRAATRTIFLLIFLAGVFLLGKAYRIGGPLSSDASPPFNLGIEAERLNATLPEMVSEGVRLDETRAGPGNSFAYIYTILDDSRVSDLSPDRTKLEDLGAQLHNRVCVMMPAFREHGVIVTYSFRDGSGKTIAEIKIDPMDC